MLFKTSDHFQMRFEQQTWAFPHSVLFIHGNLACSEWWFPTIEELRSQTARVQQSSATGKDWGRGHQAGALITADWRGYGGSKGLRSKEEIQFERYAADYIELLDHLKIEKTHVVGHSTGGLIAMMAVLQQPHRFHSLVLLDSVGLNGLELTFPLEVVLQHFDRLSQDKDFCRQVLASTIEGLDPESPFFEQLLEITWKCDPICWRSVPEVLATQIDLSARSKELRLPTFILHGEKDLVLPPSGSAKLHQQILNSRLEIISGQGHSLNLENPRLFAQKLMHFFRN